MEQICQYQNIRTTRIGSQCYRCQVCIVQIGGIDHFLSNLSGYFHTLEGELHTLYRVKSLLYKKATFYRTCHF